VEQLLAVPGINRREGRSHTVYWIEGRPEVQLAVPRHDPVLPCYVREAVAMLRLVAPEGGDDEPHS